MSGSTTLPVEIAAGHRTLDVPVERRAISCMAKASWIAVAGRWCQVDGQQT
jgi:hypothetical protein